LFRFVYLPSSSPIVLTTVRLSVGTAVAVLYFTEVTATYLGLGYYIFLMSATVFDYAATYAGAIAMGLLGLVLYFFVDWLEKRLCPWKFAVCNEPFGGAETFEGSVTSWRMPRCA
jgi:NitT/TauT family transport system permease protein